MALNLRFGHGRTLPEFREGSELVEGLRSVGLRNRQDSTSASYIDINQFENNWEDLDEEFSKHDILEKIELEKVPDVKNVHVYSYDEKVEPSEVFGGKNNRDNNLSRSKVKSHGLTVNNSGGQGFTSTNSRGQGLSNTNSRGQGFDSIGRHNLHVFCRSDNCTVYCYLVFNMPQPGANITHPLFS